MHHNLILKKVNWVSNDQWVLIQNTSGFVVFYKTGDTLLDYGLTTDIILSISPRFFRT